MCRTLWPSEYERFQVAVTYDNVARSECGNKLWLAKHKQQQQKERKLERQKEKMRKDIFETGEFAFKE